MSNRRRTWWSGRALVALAGFGGVAGCAGPAVQPPAAPSVARPVFPCRFASGPIVIDGKLDEAAWTEAPVIDGFRVPWEPGSRSARSVTRARVLWNSDNLYLAAEMDDGDLYADVTEHDGNTWDNDVFEVFLKPAADKPAYYELHVNAANAVFDLFLPRRGHVGRFKRHHQFHIESAVKLRGTLDAWADKDEGWTVEIRIPWSDLQPTGGRPEPGADWRFALCRYDFDVAHEQPELSTIAPLSRRDFHHHEDYATLRFLGPGEGTASDRAAAQGGKAGPASP